MSVLVCASCCEHVDTDVASLVDPDFKECDACYLLRFDCKSCGEQCADPDEDPPSTRLTCKECHAIGRDDHQRDVEKDERAERARGNA